MNVMSKNGRHDKFPVPTVLKEDMSGKSIQQLEEWLRRQGFKPVSSKTKADLKKAGCWGMPEE